MTELHRAADKFFCEVDHLDRLLAGDEGDLDEDTLMIALSVAKRGKKHLTLVVRELARLRDQLQP